MARPKYYAVAIGRKPGIYSTWDLCNEQVCHFKGAIFKKFDTFNEAKSYCDMHGKKNDTALTSQAVNLSSHVSSLESVTSMSAQLVYAAPYFHVVDRPTAQTSADDDINGNQVSVQQQSPYQTISTDGSWRFEDSKEAQHYTKNDIKIVYVHVAMDWKGARAGIGIYWPDNQAHNVSTLLEGKTTQRRAEIQSAIMALRIAKRRGYKRVAIRTKSKYLLNAITDWIQKWVVNGWTKKSKSPVKNSKDFAELLTFTRRLDVDWEETRTFSVGHTLSKQLASEGLKFKLNPSI